MLQKFLLTIILMFSCHGFAKQLYNFSSISANYLEWTDKAEERSGGFKQDFPYLELEGGMGYSFGDFYGFIDFENPGQKQDNSPTEFRTAAKVTADINLGKSNWNAYFSVYDFRTISFNDQNRVAGISYNYNPNTDFWIKPFFGFHNQLDNPDNGYMMGWVLSYNYRLLGQSFNLTNWHETEFDRSKDYAAGNGSSVGQNGAVANWLNIDKFKATAGLQYRYSYNKLGTAGYVDAAILSLKRNF